MLVPSKQASASSYKVFNAYSMSLDEDKFAGGLKIGSYIIRYYADDRGYLTSAKLDKKGNIIKEVVLDKLTGMNPEYISIISNGKIVYYVRQHKLGSKKTDFYSIKINGKNKKKIGSVVTVDPVFHNIYKGKLYFTQRNPSKSGYYGYYSAMDINTGKVTRLVRDILYNDVPGNGEAKYKRVNSPGKNLPLLRYNDDFIFTYPGSRYVTIVEINDSINDYNGNKLKVHIYDNQKETISKAYELDDYRYIYTEKSEIYNKNIYLVVNRNVGIAEIEGEYVLEAPVSGKKKFKSVFYLPYGYIDKVKDGCVYYRKDKTAHSVDGQWVDISWIDTYYKYNIKTKNTTKLTKKRYIKQSGYSAF